MILDKEKQYNRGKQGCRGRHGSGGVKKVEQEKQQNRGKQGWPDAGKDTEHGGDKKVITLDRHKWKPIEQPSS